ncbi:hypothetical protein DYB26_007747 [Aphanomyces astaci]|uniref:Nucleotide-diphospho-sugar transferase domain-containing protein n=1 Tax=Aphanomyces astaci TaxID=112090 RepID=A0A3R6Z514_APHAT|nr:hypothetical protein DYB26_007747 [Aphanomyces astaci]
MATGERRNARRGCWTWRHLLWLLWLGIVVTMASTFGLIQRHWTYVPPVNLAAQAAYATKFPNVTRGIVMTMSDAMVPIGASLVLELRSLGNSDPIQVMHCLASDLSARSIDILTATDANLQVVDICRVLLDADLLPSVDIASEFQSYWLKPLALLLSSFDQVMLMDADNIFLRNPSLLWNSTQYTDTGTLFFYDRVIPSNWGLNEQRGGVSYLSTFLAQFPYHSFNLTAPKCPSERLRGSAMFAQRTAHEQDSSLVLLDKRRAGRNVRNILWYLTTRLRFKQSTPFSHGDKESFWLAFELGQVRYAFSPWAASVVAAPGDMEAHPETLCGSLAQYIPTSNASAVLLFVNGRGVIDVTDVLDSRGDKMPNDATTNWTARGATLTERIPRYAVPRYTRDRNTSNLALFDQTCLVDAHATAISPAFIDRATRRIHMAVQVASRMQW